MGVRHPNPRLVKLTGIIQWTTSRGCSACTRTPSATGSSKGCPTIDDRRPDLILGRELSRFLHERRQKAKQSCGPGRIFCIACRAPKVPAEKMADCTATGTLAGSLCGICPDCGRLIYRRVNLAKIDAVRGELEITFTQPRARIARSTAPSVNCDSSSSYGDVARHRQAEIIRALGKSAQHACIQPAVP